MRPHTQVEEFVDDDVVLEAFVLVHEVEGERDFPGGRAVAPPVFEILEAQRAGVHLEA
jgi:hypothetical protein